MGYTPHPKCTLPSPDDPNKIWRYMDFTQFISMLENQYFFFSRADNFDDPFEGSLPQTHEENVREDIFHEKSVNWSVQLLPKFRKLCKKYTFLNCWHLNGGESAAMWDIYLRSNQGICIQSTIDDLIDGLDTEEEVYISKVDYINYEEDDIPGWQGLGDTLSPFIYKRGSFRHESEVRAIIQDLPWQEEGKSREITAEDIRSEDLDGDHYDPGRTVDVDLETVIDTIRVSPKAEPWVEKLVANVCKTYELEADLIVESRMSRDPYH
ncbi:hypothetical protein [Natrinema sp. CGMCC1.2065]|uniref:hypothetical protein n=1 Tax=Natrinema sp. CGMCC1.2065 TaxID=3445767 RepID=UPI003F4A2017